jgi:hypothetical protein
MDPLAWRITYEWNQAKNNLKTIAQMQEVWKGLLQAEQYQCLAGKRRESVRYLWEHTRQRTLAENQVHGRWLNGEFYANWCDLPEEYKYDDNLLESLPSGHFWLHEGQVTKVRYFVPENARKEDAYHFHSNPLAC